MPRLKKLSPRIETYPFKVKILWVRYDYELNGRIFKPNHTFRIGAVCKEVNSSANETFGDEFKVNFVVRFEDYKNRVIRKNDIILLNDRVKWVPRGKYVYRNCEKEKVLTVPLRLLKRGKDNIPYVDDPVYPFAVRVGLNDWKIYERYADDIVAKIGYDKEHVIDLYFDDKEEMLTFEGGEFFVTEEEYNTLKDNPDGKVYFKPIVSHIPLAGAWFTIKFEVDEYLQKMIMTINKIKKGE